jgi:hypothetical protein
MTPAGVSKIIRVTSRSHPPPTLSAFAGGQVDEGRIFVDTINGRLRGSPDRPARVVENRVGLGFWPLFGLVRTVAIPTQELPSCPRKLSCAS